MPVKKRKVRKKILKRKATKKKITKKAIKKRATIKKPKEKVIGIITHYFPHVKAAVLKLKIPLSVGDNIKIKGHTTDFTQAVSSLQINRTPVDTAKKGEEIGLLVNSRVRRKDVVTKV